jgi:hypothetical protein
MAHVIGAAAQGPRPNSTLPVNARGSYQNLLLLCAICHTIVDKAEEKYPEQLITQWKNSHKEKIAALFGIQRFDSRESARAAISPILDENRMIFTQYGPLTDERFNPESSMPAQWLRKIRVKIIPNNRQLLAACDANAHLLSQGEVEIVELFRQHVDDFEAKHIGESRASGAQFPTAMKNLFIN